MSESTNNNGANKCLRPGCSAKVYARGLCESDYEIARRLVKNKLTTWDALAEAGKVKKPARVGRATRIDWFLNG
jgi:hypothetical protein